MLIELRISQLAIVDELVIPIQPGLTVLTGETGAGKSVIAGALSLLCGAPAPKDLVRQGEECAWVEGVFDLSAAPVRREALARAGIRLGADGILVLRRELRLQGRNRVVINGLVSSLALLEQVGPALMTIQSQDQQRELTDPAFARDLLDELLEAGDLRREMREAWQAHEAALAALAARRHEEAAAAEQLDLWRYQAEELGHARLREGEEDELAEALAVKRHAGQLMTGAARALEQIEGSDASARAALGASVAALRPLAGASRRLAEILQSVEAAEQSASEAARALRRFLDGLDLDPADLEEMEARKALYEDLRRKYRLDAPGLIALASTLAERIARQEAAVSDLAALDAEAAAARARLGGAAARLRARRAEGAGRVARSAEARIRPLGLSALELEFGLTPRAAPDGPIAVDGHRCQAGADGAERVELRVRTNAGERMGPLGDIASGGERSRIHLGLTALRRSGPEPPLLLCDEIDAGLGMDAGRPVGELLRRLAEAGQTLCITHLPTIAIYAATHLKVEKRQRGGRSVLGVRPVEGEGRVAEVIRLLGGGARGAGSDSRRAYAEALLAQASRS